MEIIKQKIKNGEGYIKMKSAGIIKVSAMIPTDTVIKTYSKHDYKLVNDELVLKTDEDKATESAKKTQQKLLNQFKPLIDAMTFQEIAKGKGSKAENSIFTDDNIKDWGDYIGEIVDGNLGAVMPEIPEKYRDLL